MATPEWYDTEVTGDYGDEFFPDWKNLEFGPYARPDWFIQGPRVFPSWRTIRCA